MREINLNFGESPIEKLEIPIDFVCGKSNTKAGDSSFKVVQNMMNSNVTIEYSFLDSVSVIAQLQGPTEAKFASKQDSNKTFIEVNLKGGWASQGEDKLDFKKLKYDIKSVLE